MIARLRDDSLSILWKAFYILAIEELRLHCWENVPSVILIFAFLHLPADSWLKLMVKHTVMSFCANNSIVCLTMIGRAVRLPEILSSVKYSMPEVCWREPNVITNWQLIRQN